MYKEKRKDPLFHVSSMLVSFRQANSDPPRQIFYIFEIQKFFFPLHCANSSLPVSLSTPRTGISRAAETVDKCQSWINKSSSSS